MQPASQPAVLSIGGCPHRSSRISTNLVLVGSVIGAHANFSPPHRYSCLYGVHELLLHFKKYSRVDTVFTVWLQYRVQQLLWDRASVRRTRMKWSEVIVVSRGGYVVRCRRCWIINASNGPRTPCEGVNNVTLLFSRLHFSYSATCEMLLDRL